MLKILEKENYLLSTEKEEWGKKSNDQKLKNSCTFYFYSANPSKRGRQMEGVKMEKEFNFRYRLLPFDRAHSHLIHFESYWNLLPFKHRKSTHWEFKSRCIIKWDEGRRGRRNEKPSTAAVWYGFVFGWKIEQTLGIEQQKTVWNEAFTLLPLCRGHKAGPIRMQQTATTTVSWKLILAAY